MLSAAVVHCALALLTPCFAQTYDKIQAASKTKGYVFRLDDGCYLDPTVRTCFNVSCEFLQQQIGD